MREAGARQAAKFAPDILGQGRSLPPGAEAPFARVDQRRRHFLRRVLRQGRCRQLGRHTPGGKMGADSAS
jgi:hypothetical protein